MYSGRPQTHSQAFIQATVKWWKFHQRCEWWHFNILVYSPPGYTDVLHIRVNTKARRLNMHIFVYGSTLKREALTA
jgi:hypothetical protein